jgi:putative methionine-R-sulfoxide reductase with GAF domain
VIEQQTKPVIDKQTFQKMLEAAFVLQEHNRRMQQVKASPARSGKPRLEERAQERVQPSPQKKIKAEIGEPRRPSVDYTLTLAEIVAAQHHIQAQHLDLDNAAAVVAERIAQMTHASGAGIGIVVEATVRYRAAAGATALPVGTEVPLKGAISQASIRTGQVIRCKDVNTEFLFDPEAARQRSIRSLVAVPIHYDGNIVGALELYFDKVEGYAEQDIHTCQLMAGLVTEAMGRQAGAALKESMAAERSSMLAAIEKLQPKLSVLAKAASATGSGESRSKESTAADTVVCWKCGNDLLRPEQFCGKCGAPREQGIVTGGKEGTAKQGTESQSTLMQGSLQEALPFTESEAAELANSLSVPSEDESEILAAHSDAPPVLRDDMVWTSAAKAQDFLESLSPTPAPGALLRFWSSRRGDFYLVLAIILVVFLIGWGIWSNQSVNAKTASAGSRTVTRAKSTTAEANLSMFDRLLIDLGVAEAPDPPDSRYKGNPNTQVWVDLSTAQYYCPGSDLYQKTGNGKFTSQRDAQLDQFEPAYRKPCD